MTKLMTKIATGLLATAVLASTAITDASAASEMKYASSVPPTTPWAKEMQAQADRINANTEGAVEAKLYTGGVLGDEVKIVQSLRRGRIQAAYVSVAPFPSIVPEIGVISLPFLWESPDEIDYVLDTYLFDAYAPLFEKAGLKLLAWSEIGSSALGGNRTITKPADLAGMRVRVPGSKLIEDYIGSLKATPVDIPVSEVASSLQTGLTDGVMTTTIALYFFDMYKHIDNLVMLNDQYFPSVHVVSKKWFDGLDDKTKAGVIKDAKSTTPTGRAVIRKVTAGLGQKIAASGVKVKTLSDAERAVWVGFSKEKVIDRQLQLMGGKSREIYDLVLKGKAEFKAK